MKSNDMVIHVPPTVNVDRFTRALRSQGFALQPLPDGTYRLTDATPVPALASKTWKT